MYNYCLPLLYFVLRFYKAVNKVLSYNLIYKDDNVKTHFVRYFWAPSIRSCVSFCNFI